MTKEDKTICIVAALMVATLASVNYVPIPNSEYKKKGITYVKAIANYNDGTSQNVVVRKVLIELSHNANVLAKQNKA